MSQYSVPLKKIVEELGITVLRKSSDFDTRVITSANVDRPALQLAGVYNYFDPARLQVIGRVESTFLESLTEDQRRKSFNKFMSYDIHGIIICHDCQPFPECLEMAEKYDRNVMIVEDVQIESDVEDGGVLTVTGRSLESILERRIIINKMRMLLL